MVQKVQQRDAQKRGLWAVELRSHLPIAQQERAMGVTWLDRNLAADGRLAHQSFGAQVRDAMQARVDLMWKMKPEVVHGNEKAVQPRVQA
ncbi:hypothetical protein J2W36_003004 [Variovorax ginsengisoli]|uniref:Uncharacterized protein n=1 Tax=Variovorax ginsengisoli TaxID=363844 RepID=A0ABT9SA72_9BURK|nr:hypothetical protein [Variovorax ginsengisoli]